MHWHSKLILFADRLWILGVLRSKPSNAPTIERTNTRQKTKSCSELDGRSRSCLLSKKNVQSMTSFPIMLWLFDKRMDLGPYPTIFQLQLTADPIVTHKRDLMVGNQHARAAVCLRELPVAGSMPVGDSIGKRRGCMVVIIMTRRVILDIRRHKIYTENRRVRVVIIAIIVGFAIACIV